MITFVTTQAPRTYSPATPGYSATTVAFTEPAFHLKQLSTFYCANYYL